MYVQSEPVQLYVTDAFPDDELSHGQPVEVFPLISTGLAPRENLLYLDHFDTRYQLVFRDRRDEERTDYVSPEEIKLQHRDRDTDYAIDLDSVLAEAYYRGYSLWLWLERDQPLRLATTKEMSACGLHDAIYNHPQFMSSQAYYTWKRENLSCRTTNDQLRRRAHNIVALTIGLNAALPFNKDEQILYYTSSLVKASAVLNALAEHFIDNPES